ncbi:MAG: T9SS type A sorting domain-containing protein [Bacteroidia bacterium]|nr:T9SS type A sorting domain-containing protein [Bacteroidia bacterium]
MRTIKPILIIIVICCTRSHAYSQWIQKTFPGPTNSYVNDLCVAGTNNIIFSNGSNNIFASTNGGDDFIKTTVSGVLIYVSAPSEYIAFYTQIVSGVVELYKSTNGGQAWSKKVILVNDTNAFGVMKAPHKVLGITDSLFIAAGNLQDSTVILALSTDGGVNWLRANSNFKLKNFGNNVTSNFYKFNDTIMLEFKDPNVIKSVPTYLFSYDNGKSWSQVKMPLFNVFPKLIWLTSQCAIWQNRSNNRDMSITYDGGKTFDSTYSTFKSSSTYYLRKYKSASSTKLISFNNSGLYYSNDLGKTWIDQDQMYHSYVAFSNRGYCVSIVSSDNDHDDELYIFDFFTGLTPASENKIAQINFYPNPSHDIIHLTHDAKKVEIFDTYGKCILVGNGNELCISSLSNGIYLLRVNDSALHNKLIVY